MPSDFKIVVTKGSSLYHSVYQLLLYMQSAVPQLSLCTPFRQFRDSYGCQFYGSVYNRSLAEVVEFELKYIEFNIMLFRERSSSHARATSDATLPRLIGMKFHSSERVELRMAFATDGPSCSVPLSEGGKDLLFEILASSFVVASIRSQMPSRPPLLLSLGHVPISPSERRGAARLHPRLLPSLPVPTGRPRPDTMTT